MTLARALTASEHFELTPCGPTIGAEISGLRLGEPLAAEAVSDLKQALLDWKVLFFRDQRLPPEAHVALARHWGEPIDYPLPEKGALPEIARLELGPDRPGAENIWHSDVSYQETPALGAVLKAVRLPPSGGDTLWADMSAAYAGLSEAVKQRIEGLTAVHDALARHVGNPAMDKARQLARDVFPVTEHPVVRIHPETGARILYVNRFYTTHIVGLSERESAELLDLLCEQPYHPEYQCRFRWTPGAIALWDNRSTQHYAVSDYFPHVRIMERVTIADPGGRHQSTGQGR